MVEEVNKPKVIVPNDIGLDSKTTPSPVYDDGSSSANIKKAQETVDSGTALASSIDNAVDKGVFIIGKILDMVAKKKGEEIDPNADHIVTAGSFAEAQQLMTAQQQGRPMPQAPTPQAPTPQLPTAPLQKPVADVKKAIATIKMIAGLKISQDFNDTKVKDVILKIHKKYYEKTVKEIWSDLVKEHEVTAEPIIKEFIEESYYNGN